LGGLDPGVSQQILDGDKVRVSIEQLSSHGMAEMMTGKIVALTTDLAIELAPFNICANAILPGLIRTEMMEQRLPPNINKDDFYATLGKTVPMQRVGTPEDVAGTALFLASDLSAYITADRLIIGGGIPWQYLKR
jgi:NAD(P)-dependent dehydrogenase (short-subunit alcohol dehydrogenase family)